MQFDIAIMQMYICMYNLYHDHRYKLCTSYLMVFSRLCFSFHVRFNLTDNNLFLLQTQVSVCLII